MLWLPVDQEGYKSLARTVRNIGYVRCKKLDYYRDNVQYVCFARKKRWPRINTPTGCDRVGDRWVCPLPSAKEGEWTAHFGKV